MNALSNAEVEHIHSCIGNVLQKDYSMEDLGFDVEEICKTSKEQLYKYVNDAAMKKLNIDNTD